MRVSKLERVIALQWMEDGLTFGCETRGHDQSNEFQSSSEWIEHVLTTPCCWCSFSFQAIMQFVPFNCQLPLTVKCSFIPSAAVATCVCIKCAVNASHNSKRKHPRHSKIIKCPPHNHNILYWLNKSHSIMRMPAKTVLFFLEAFTTQHNTCSAVHCVQIHSLVRSLIVLNSFPAQRTFRKQLHDFHS